MQRRRFVGLIVTTAIAGCLGDESSTDAPTTTEPMGSDEQPETTPTETQAPSGEPEAEIQNAELVDEETSYGSTNYHATATIENIGGARLRLLSVSIKFFDEEGSVLDSTEREIFSLKTGQQWDLRVPYTETDSMPADVEFELGELEVGFENYSHPSELNLADVTLEQGESPAIAGTIENTTDQTIDVYAFGQFLTEDSVVLETGTDTIMDLDGGESWSFSIDALFVDDQRAQRAAQYEIYLTAE